MRKSLNYKQITLVIGILVALLIALVLWTAAPVDVVVGTGSLHSTGMIPVARDFFEAARMVMDIR